MKSINCNLFNLVVLLLFVTASSLAATKIHVKREGSSESPKVHVWTKIANNDQGITNSSNWPNNLPQVTAEDNDWFSYSFDSNFYGCLFVYNDIQTEDFKYYTSNQWIILNPDGSLKSASNVNPETSNDINITESIAPKSNGIYNEGDTVLVSINNPGGKEIYYTTDGSNPSAIIGSINGTLYNDPISIAENTTLKASLAGGYYVGYPILGSPKVKTYEFEEVVIIPTFTYSTTPGLSDNGTYPEGATVEVNFNLSNPSNDPDWDIYYSLDGNDVDLSRINGGSYTNPIRYAESFNVTSDLIVYAKLYNVVTGHSQGVSPMVFSFEQPTPQQTIYVKKENTLSPPKIHVWRGDGETGPKITDSSNWPNNLSLMTYDHTSSDGWYSFTFDAPNSYGTLFYLGNHKTIDYKFYSEDRYFLFDQDNNLISNTTSKPGTPDIVLTATPDIEPKANGKYDAGTVVTVSFESNGGFDSRYIAYTTDGTEPSTSSTFTQLNKTEGYPTTIQISSNTQLRAIEEQLYRSNPRSNEINLNFEFEEPSSYLTLETSKTPQSNGKFIFGETIEVSISRSIGCGGCSFAIYYTTDGTEPSESDSKILYTDAIPVTHNTTIKAAINSYVGNDWYPSEKISLEFATSYDIIFSENIDSNSNGKYSDDAIIELTLNNPSNLDIYYTTDGSDPTAIVGDINGILYNSPISISETTTIKVSTAGGYAYGYPILGMPDVKTYEFEEPFEEVPSFTYSTNPGLSDNGTYPTGTTVSTTFSLNYPSDNPNWIIYYSLDGSEVDLNNIGTSSQNAILYAGAFDISTDLVVYAKMVNTYTGQNQGVSPMIYSFEEPVPEYTIYVKKESGNTPPKIHVWSNPDVEDRAALTNSSNWPNNLPPMTYTYDNGWYQFTVTDLESYGTLFILDNDQTDDYKFYSEDRYFLFDENNSLISNTITKPGVEDILLTMTKDIEPKANGKYDIGTVVTVTFESNGGFNNRYIAYTTDGTDPASSNTFTQYNKTEGYTPTLQISSNTELRAIEEQLYRNNPRSNEVSFNFEFEEPYEPGPDPDFSYTTSHEKNEIGEYPQEATVTTTFSQNNPEWVIYYSLNGTDVDLNNTGGHSQNAILYTEPFEVNDDVIVYAKLVNTVTNENQSVAPITFNFEGSVPEFSFTASHERNEFGQYPQGATVEFTFNLSNPNWTIYYSLDWDPVDSNNIGTDSQNAILYNGPISINSNITIFLKVVHNSTGQIEELLPITFNFYEGEVSTFYVKRIGHDYSPKIHLWTKESGEDVPITDTSNWPNNLHTNMPKLGDWYVYSLLEQEVGLLYIYGDGLKTPDFKYYSEDTYILLAENGELISITHTEPSSSQSRINTGEELPNKGLRLGPNPTNNNFVVNFSNGKTENALINIYDLSGKVLFTEATPESSFIYKEYSASNLGLGAGVYLISIETNSSNEIKRLIVK